MADSVSAENFIYTPCPKCPKWGADKIIALRESEGVKGLKPEKLFAIDTWAAVHHHPGRQVSQELTKGKIITWSKSIANNDI